MTPAADGSAGPDLSQALLESEEKFRILAENASVGVLVRHPGESHYVNQAISEIFESTREEMVTPGFLEGLIHPEDLPNVQDKVRRIRSGDLDAAHFFIRARLRSGCVRPLEIFASRLVYSKGSATLLIVMDRTEQQRLEEEIRQNNLQLAEQAASLEKRVIDEVAKRAAREAVLQGQAKMAAMGEMLAAIAHQWRQPVSTLGMVLQNLVTESRAGGLDAARLESAVGKARQQLGFLSQTVTSFLSFYRPDRGSVGIDLVPLLLETASLLKAQLDYNFVDLRLDTGAEIDGESLWVLGRPNDLKQVIVILLQNAKDAILARRAADPNTPSLVDVRVRPDGSSIRVEVEDTGGGIPPEILPRIFEPYFSTKPQGTGIGLSLARSLVEASLGGTLSASNGPLGALFTILLPPAG